MSVVFQANVTASRRAYEREASDTYLLLAYRSAQACVTVGALGGANKTKNGWKR
jgi:hypothetical protein